MWRAFFMAVGVTLVILGGECLIIEKAVLSSPKERQVSRTPTQAPPSYWPGSDYLLGSAPPPPAKKREIQPPDWAPFALAAAGTIVAIYSVTLAKD